METRVEALRRELGGLTRAYRAQPYPRELRARIAQLGVEWAAAGRSLGELASLLELRRETLERWCETCEAVVPASPMVPVRVVDGPGALPVASTTVTVVSPRGWRLEGLAVSDGLAFMRSVG